MNFTLDKRGFKRRLKCDNDIKWEYDTQNTPNTSYNTTQNTSYNTTQNTSYNTTQNTSYNTTPNTNNTQGNFDNTNIIYAETPQDLCYLIITSSQNTFSKSEVINIINILHKLIAPKFEGDCSYIN